MAAFQFGIDRNQGFSFCIIAGFYVSVLPRIRIGVAAMIVCSCNVLSDHDVRSTVCSEGGNARTPGEVYGCLGCSVRCGRCARSIKKIMTVALESAEEAA
jgi:bacterioferritin-associated ferredoxin